MIKAVVSDFSGVILQLDEKNAATLNSVLLSFYKELSKNITMVLFSNAISFRIPVIYDTLTGIFSKLYRSGEIGFSKTSPQAYLWIASQLHIEPHEIIFIDDSKSNLDAAKQAGLQTVQFIHTHQAIQEMKNYVA